jgi:hypothetical protein
LFDEVLLYTGKFPQNLLAAEWVAAATEVNEVHKRAGAKFAKVLWGKSRNKWYLFHVPSAQLMIYFYVAFLLRAPVKAGYMKVAIKA